MYLHPRVLRLVYLLHPTVLCREEDRKQGSVKALVCIYSERHTSVHIQRANLGSVDIKRALDQDVGVFTEPSSVFQARSSRVFKERQRPFASHARERPCKSPCQYAAAASRHDSNKLLELKTLDAPIDT